MTNMDFICDKANNVAENGMSGFVYNLFKADIPRLERDGMRVLVLTSSKEPRILCSLSWGHHTFEDGLTFEQAQYISGWTDEEPWKIKLIAGGTKEQRKRREEEEAKKRAMKLGEKLALKTLRAQATMYRETESKEDE